MSDITPYAGSTPVRRGSAVERRTTRAVETARSSAIVRMAGVRAEETVHAEKMASVDHVTSVAMTGHAMLVRQREALAGGDALLEDELKLFTDSSRVIKAQMLVDFTCNIRHR